MYFRENNQQYSPREMRFLVTQKCTYQCLFCHGEGLQSKKDDHFNASDYSFLYKVGKESFGMDTVTLTGGEPLVRKDIVEITENLHKLGAKITLTTNGLLLEDISIVGKFLDKVNVSFHINDKEKYEKLVLRKNSYEKALRGLYLLRQEYPDLKIVINTTCVKDFNYSDKYFKKIINLAEEIGASIKFVELFPSNSKGYVSIDNIAKKIIKLGFWKVDSEIRKFNFSNGKTKISLVRIFCAIALRSDDPGLFCNKNNDLFVSPDGQIKPCRNNKHEFNIFNDVKNRNETAVANLIKNSFDFLGNDCAKYLQINDFEKTISVDN